MTVRTGCVANIGPGERRRRLVGGLVVLALTLALAIYLVIGGAPRLWRLAIVIPAFGAGLGIFQARAQTCVALVARGLRNMDDGERAVTDQEQLARLRVQSREVYVRAAAAALIIAVIVLVLPL